MTRKGTGTCGMMKPQDGFIDVDLDDSSTCLYSIAIVAYIVRESEKDAVFKSYYESDLDVYVVKFKDLNEYKRIVISVCVEGQIAD